MLVVIDNVSRRTRDKQRKLDISESIGLQVSSHVLSSMLADIDGVSRTCAKRRNFDIPESIGLPSKLIDIDCNGRRRAKRRILRFPHAGKPDIVRAFVCF